MKQLLFYFFSLLLFAGCVMQPSIDSHALLAQKLQNISPNINQNEAKDCARQVYLHAATLQKDYALVSPPLFHNFLVNAGIKKRGLCWHFAFDLLSHVKKQNYRSFDYYIVGANINDYWQEHNALLLTCKECALTKGVIIDLWRNSGEPFFVEFGEDAAYNWSVRGEKR